MILTHFTAVGFGAIFVTSQERVAPRCGTPQAARGRGIGGALIRRLCEQGGRPVRLRVERTNPALGLYRRLGFVEVGDDNVYALMEWAPNTDPAAAQELN